MYPKELHKDKIEESSIISAFVQLMDIRFKDDPCYPYWKNRVLPVVKKYSLEVLGFDEEESKKNIAIVERRKVKTTFKNLAEVEQFLKRIEDDKIKAEGRSSDSSV